MKTNQGGQTVVEWANERLCNTYRLAHQKTGRDREGWLDDAAYWRAILEVFHATEHLLAAIDSGGKHGRCLDHLPRAPVANAREALRACDAPPPVHVLTERLYLFSVIANYHENGHHCDECPPDYDDSATCELWETAKGALLVQAQAAAKGE